MTKALITGGAGFIGSHLAETLLQQGWTVEILDDLTTGSIKNIAHLKARSGFSYVLDTVMNRSLMLELIDRADVVFHLACRRRRGASDRRGAGAHDQDQYQSHGTDAGPLCP